MASPSPAYYAAVSIDGPLPSPPALTLVGAARVVPETKDRWIAGATTWPYGYDLPDVWDACQNPSSSGHVKAEGEHVDPVTFGAFAVLIGITCTTRSIGNPAEWQARADRLLLAREHWGIEHEFWTGALKPDNPHLAQSDADVLFAGAGGTSIENAIALMEQEIADKGGDGMIHLRPGVFSQLTNELSVSVANGVAKTMLGTRIVPGVGYPGTDKSGNAPSGTAEWAYVTGPVEIRRSDTVIVPGSISEATDRAQNVTTFRAERYVLITWDQRIHGTVKVDRAFTGFTS